jgi:hypothetical protein
VSSSDWIAVASLVVALAALGVSWYAIRRANRTTSAATLVTLNDGFRQAWGRFFSETGDRRKNELAELLNLFEIACAIYLENSLTGNSRTLMREYINSILRILVKNEYTNTEVGSLLESESTFVFIRKFLKEKGPELSVIIPPKWYQGPARLKG